MKGGLRLQSSLSLRHGGLGDDLRPAVLVVLVLLHGNGNLWLIPRDSAPVLASLAPKWKLLSCAHWRPPGLGHHGSRHQNLTRRGLHRNLRSSGASPGELLPSEVLAPSASRGLAPREGLESLLVKMGRTGPLAAPRRGPQAGKSGDPRSQNADSSPRAQGALGLGFEAKPKGKGEAPRAPIACGPDWRVAPGLNVGISTSPRCLGNRST